jgi:hypothetical protein
MPEVHIASTSYRLAILFAVFEAVRFKSYIASFFDSSVSNSVWIRVYDFVCDGRIILLDSYNSLLANHDRLTVSESNKVTCFWISRWAFGSVNLRRGGLSLLLCCERS